MRTTLERDALIRIGGLDANGYEGFHNVDDRDRPDECPGCWAWWGLGLGARPTQADLDALRDEFRVGCQAELLTAHDEARKA